MRAVSLLRVAAEAELLRLRHMLKRQGVRAAYGVIAAVFTLGVLVLINVTAWQALRWSVQPFYATLDPSRRQCGDCGGVRLIGHVVVTWACRTRSHEDPATGHA